MRSRESNLKEQFSSAIKNFFGDNFIVLFYVVATVPFLTTYLGLMPAPSWLKDEYVKMIQLTTIVITFGLAILVFNSGTKLAKHYSGSIVILGVGFLILGATLLLSYIYIMINLDENGKLILKKDDYYVYYFRFISYIYILIFSIFISFFIRDHINRSEAYRRIRHNYKNHFFERYALLISFTSTTIIIIILLYFFFFNFDFIDNSKIIEYSENKITLFVYYIIYYPLIAIGLILILSHLFEKQNNYRHFYRIIERIDKQNFNYLHKIARYIFDFDSWNIPQIQKLNKDIVFNKIPFLGNKRIANESKIELSKHTFYWLTFKSYLKFFEKSLRLLSKKGSVKIIATGDVIDEIYSYLNANLIDKLKSFNATSYKDYNYWISRGEYYIRLNRELVYNGVLIQRIFIFDENDFAIQKDKDTKLESKYKNFENYLKKDEIDLSIYHHSKDLYFNFYYSEYFNNFQKYIRVILSQMASGILTYFLDKETAESKYYSLRSSKIISLSKLDLDFGVYNNFAASRFNKDLKIGGRILELDFNKSDIDDYSKYFSTLLFATDINIFEDTVVDIVDQNFSNEIVYYINHIHSIRTTKSQNNDSLFIEHVYRKNLNTLQSASLSDDERILLMNELRLTFIVLLRVLLFIEYMIDKFSDRIDNGKILIFYIYFNWKEDFLNEFRREEASDLNRHLLRDDLNPMLKSSLDLVSKDYREPLDAKGEDLIRKLENRIF